MKMNLRMHFLICALLIALASGLAWGTPEEDVAREVEKAARDANPSPDRILKILIDHPTESVVLEAIKWPWNNFESYKLEPFLRPWVLRSPKVRDFFKKMLFDDYMYRLDSPSKGTAAKLLAPFLRQDQQMHEQVRAIAAAGNRGAVEALTPFVDQSIEDQSVIYEVIYKGMTADKTFRGAARSGIEVLSAMDDPPPKFVRFIFNSLKTPRDTSSLHAIVSNLDHRFFKQPKLSQMQKLLAKTVDFDLNTADGKEVAINAVKILLELDPSEENLHRLATLPKVFAQHGYYNSRLFETAEEWIGKSAALDHAIDEAFEILATRLKENIFIGNYQLLFRAYLSLHRDARSFKPEEFKQFFEHVVAHPEISIREQAELELIAYADHLPPAAQPFIERAISHIDPKELHHYFESNRLKSVSSAMVKVVEKGCFSGGQDSSKSHSFEHAVILAASLAPYDARCRDILQQLLKTGEAWQKGTVGHYIHSLGLPGLEPWTTDSVILKKPKTQRELWTNPVPSMGWRQAAQAFAFDPESDPFLFSMDVRLGSAQEVNLTRQGAEARNRLLDEAELQLQKKGIITRPVDDAKRKFERRKQAILARKKETKLTAKERRMIETQAKIALQASNPGITEDDLASSPYRERYQRLILELEWNRDAKPEKTKNNQDEIATEAWRQITLSEMQEDFRQSLKAIVKSGYGKILAVPTSIGIKHDQYEHGIALQEKDLAALTLSAEGFYWHDRPYRLRFQPRSMDEVKLEQPPQVDAFEIATLTLGNNKKSPQKIAQEVYLGRFFSAWVSSYATAYAAIKNKAASRMEGDLSEASGKEAFMLQRQLNPDRSTKMLMARLWQPIEKNPDHWRKREEQALDEGRKGWALSPPPEYLAPPPQPLGSEDGKPLRQNHLAMSFDDSPPQHTLSPRRDPWNKPPEELKKGESQVIFRIETKRENRVDLLPRYFNRAFSEDFHPSADTLNKIGNIDFEHSDSTFVLHSERSTLLKKGGGGFNPSALGGTPSL